MLSPSRLGLEARDRAIKPLSHVAEQTGEAVPGGHHFDNPHSEPLR